MNNLWIYWANNVFLKLDRIIVLVLHTIRPFFNWFNLLRLELTGFSSNSGEGLSRIVPGPTGISKAASYRAKLEASPEPL